jgi:hypothetical protein
MMASKYFDECEIKMWTLEPCPFCQSDDVEFAMRMPDFGEELAHYVRCNKCGSRTAAFRQKQTAGIVWNTGKPRVRNPYWERVCDLAEEQRIKGIKTYGRGIEMNPADAVTRIEYLQEELVDALMYCEWIKASLLQQKGTDDR